HRALDERHPDEPRGPTGDGGHLGHGEELDGHARREKVEPVFRGEEDARDRHHRRLRTRASRNDTRMRQASKLDMWLAATSARTVRSPSTRSSTSFSFEGSEW